VHAVLHERRFRELGPDALRMAGITHGPLWEWFHQIMSTQEGEPHARLRRLVSKAFTPRSAERLRPVMRATAHEFIDRFERDGRCEFVSAFAAPYPVRVIGALLGVPAGDFARFHDWSSDLSLAFGSRIAENLPRIEAGLVALSEYVDGLLAERRRAPQDDLISGLIEVEEQGDRLSPDELRAMVTVLIFGGQDTTQCQLACAVATFVLHPDPWQRLAEDPGLAASAVEEVLRYEPAGSGSPRVATESFRYRELEIEADAIVLPSASAANRDPEVYADPDRFDITRRPPRADAHLRRRRALLPRRVAGTRRAPGGAADSRPAPGGARGRRPGAVALAGADPRPRAAPDRLRPPALSAGRQSDRRPPRSVRR